MYALDVLVVALQAHGSGLAEYIPILERIATDNAVRIGVVGGAGNLRVSPDGPRTGRMVSRMPR